MAAMWVKVMGRERTRQREKGRRLRERVVRKIK